MIHKIVIRGKRYTVKAASYDEAYARAYALWFKGY